MKNNCKEEIQKIKDRSDSNNASLKLTEQFDIPAGEGIPILKLNEVIQDISMYKMLTIIAFSGVLAVMAIGYIHLL